MYQNSLIEIGSKANVVLKFKSAISINGKNYEANEPYLFLKDCKVVVNYSKIDKKGEVDKTLIANSDVKARTVSIGAISFSKKIASLLATYQESGAIYKTTQFKEFVPEEQTIYLTDDIDPTSLFVYDNDYNKISVVYIEDSNSIISNDFIDGQTYLVSFSSVGIGTKFSLNKQFVPYMSLEVSGIGNIDKETKKVMMYFDKVNLNSMIAFNFIQNDLMSAPLEFNIIDDKNNFIVFEE